MKSVKLGQNFLVNKNVAEKIVRHFLPVTGAVLEVGPGKGILTELLVKYGSPGGGKTKAVELDMGLVYKLRDRFGDHVDVVNRDILKVSLPHLFTDMPADMVTAADKINLISNVPYYISSEFMDWVISQGQYIGKGILMLQKEFVDKLAAGPDSREYNAQAVVFNYLFRLEKLFDVSPGSFSPRPKVKSRVFLFESIHRDKRVENSMDTGEFYRFVQSCFKNRRKTLFNNLEKRHHKEKLWEVFESFRINPRIRAEQVTLDGFLDIYHRLFLPDIK
jgi:16S rRNA (adenine1518-N6/adenine1519-N6)-dimethyltransferase